MRKILLPCLVCLSLSIQAQQTSVPINQKAFTLVRFLQKTHYQPLVWNDSASALLYDKWLQHLDDDKLFFTGEDIASLDVYKTKLDDELLGKSWNFFPASLAIYRRQLLKTDSMIQQLLAKPFDFSKPDNVVWPFKEYAANDKELKHRWQQYLKWHLLSKIADKLTDEKKELKTVSPADLAKLEGEERTQIIKKEITDIKNLLGDAARFQSEQEDAYLNAIAWCYDPHTNYMNLDEKKEFESEVSASEYSVGFDIEENEKGDKEISFLQPGGSAWLSGNIHKGDVLLKIKMNGTETLAEQATAEEMESLLTGTSVADVEVTIRTAAGEQKTVKLVKDKITDEEGIVKSYVLHGNKNIGYINLPGFYSRERENSKTEADLTYDGCANDVSKEIIKLKRDSIAGLILDLRYNGGGSMWEAMQLAGIFIDYGPVASEKDREGKIHFLKDPNRGTIYDGPLIVLVNGASASASEFTSAVLQDYNRALIVGGVTYGKGTAQIVLPLDTNTVSQNNNYNDFVKVTDEKFYRVDGSTTQWRGVIPDIALPDMYENDRYKERENKSALQPDNSKTGVYQKLTALPVAMLKAKSEQRIKGNTYFDAIKNFNAWLNVYLKERTIPLQWTAYADHYKKTEAMFRLLKEDDSSATGNISISNNSFDGGGIKAADAKTKAINEEYLKQIGNDKTIGEGYSILMDWINK